MNTRTRTGRPRVPAPLLLITLAVALSAAPASAQTSARATPLSPEPRLIGFGSAATVAGDLLFVGRPGESALFPMPGSEPGSVHVFGRDGAEWTEVAAISAEDVAVGDGFGKALAAGDGILAVGAPGQDEGRGAVYLFRGAGDAWSLAERLQPADLEPGDGFGSALAASGETLAVGAPGRGETGAVFVGELADVQPSEIRPGAGSAGERFGAALALEGERLLVGAPGPFDLGLVSGQPQFQAGAAYVYERGPEGWQETGRLTVPGGAAFGLAVLLSGQEALVGAPISDQATGTVFRFGRDQTGAWVARGKLGPATPAPQGLYGHALATAGDQLLVGSPGHSGLSGAVYVLDATEDGGWVEAQLLTQETRGLVGFFGSTVAAGGELLVVGAPSAEFFEGIGYVYAREAGEWVPEGDIVESASGLPPVTGGTLRCPEEGSVRGFTCENVELVSFLPVSAVGGQRGIMVSDVWGWTDPETGREYAILGRFDGTSFIDVTDAENPVYLGDLPLTEGAHANLWRDMKVYADHAFIVADNAGEHGMQVFDLTRLRDVTGPPVEFAADVVYDGIHSAHNIVINEESGFAYTVGNSGGGQTCGGALHMIDIRDPGNPTFAGCYADPQTGSSGPGYTHDAQCVRYRGPDADYRDREICFNASENALGIADVTDKQNPAPISRASYPNVAYAHQGWLTEDQRYFYLNDELDELSGSVPGTRTLVWDVRDLDDPVLANAYVSENPASDHNLYVHDGFMYQSNYVSGLRIFDISDPENPVPVGFFDTVPWSPDAAGFAGSWSNYPFFASGNIVVSSMREGLFVLRKRETELVP